MSNKPPARKGPTAAALEIPPNCPFFKHPGLFRFELPFPITGADQWYILDRLVRHCRPLVACIAYTYWQMEGWRIQKKGFGTPESFATERKARAWLAFGWPETFGAAATKEGQKWPQGEDEDAGKDSEGEGVWIDPPFTE